MSLPKNIYFRPLIVVFFVLVIASVACSLPGLSGLGGADSVAEASAIPVEDLPPAVVEMDPVPGSRLGLSRPVTFYFNQPMDQDSVESALSGQPALAGTFEWPDDATLTYTPQTPWQPETEVIFTLAESAAAKNGMKLTESDQFSYTTSGFLQVTQMLPAADSQQADPGAAVVAAFNQPVVALGADAEQSPVGFTLEPQVPGTGEWLNTSTYIYYPVPGLSGGTSYTASINPQLTSVGGAPLKEGAAWQFTTALPEVISSEPTADAIDVPLDAEIKITFNTIMNKASVEAGFSLSDGQGAVSGEFSWDDEFKVMTFTPNNLLTRGSTYTYRLERTAHALGGSALSASTSVNFKAFDHLQVQTDSDTLSDVAVDYYRPLNLSFNGDLAGENLDELISFDPQLDVSVSYFDNTINIFAGFEAESEYTMTISGGLQDVWGGTMGQDRVLTVQTNPLSASITVPIFYGDGALFVDPSDPVYYVQAVNVNSATVSVGSVSLDEMIRLYDPQVWNELQEYYPQGYRQWQAQLSTSRNQKETVRMFITPGAGLLSPGIYWVRVEGTANEHSTSFAISSYIHMLFKLSAKDALIWAVDRRDGSPVIGETVTLYNDQGEPVASGQTDEDGIFYTEFSGYQEPNDRFYAVMGSPGQQNFSLAMSTWDYGIQGWDFGYLTDYNPPRPNYYIYTDRPLYQPGHTVRFRVVAWQGYNGRYQTLDRQTVPITISGDSSGELTSLDVPLSSFGTGHASYTLPDNAPPGYYYISVGEDYGGGIAFDVADYRKPDIDLQLEVVQDELQVGDQLQMQLDSRYFFDAPAGGVDLTYGVYAEPEGFYLPGYNVGPWNINWGGSFSSFTSLLGTQVEDGAGTTDAEGKFGIAAQVKETQVTTRYNVEVTTLDETGYPISTVASAIIHPSDFYIGVRAQQWVGQADEEMSFDLKLVDWEQNPAGSHSLVATFSKVEWERDRVDRYGFQIYDPVFTQVASMPVTTDGQGLGEVSFTPPSPGTYQLEVTGAAALTQTLVWVGGPGATSWPRLDQNRIIPVADQEQYQPGDTANIFVPNPFEGAVKALVTIERGLVLDQQLIDIEGSGLTIPVPLDDDAAPNVYLSVTLLGEDEDGELAFRYGLVNLPVEPAALTLNVEVVGEPVRTEPGESVEITLKVTDADGSPVQGEFSISVVDEALLALDDPKEADILSWFYDIQGLGVRTNIALSATAELFKEELGGLGGGGDVFASTIREEFKDTGYWNAEVITGADGIARVSVDMPDDLTTWRVLARGVTADKLVGEGLSEVVTTKPLLIRTVTPRFMVVGDHVQIGAVVHNNTSDDLQVGVAVRATGLTLDEPESALQEIAIPANGRERLSWWGTVEDVEAVDLVFAANNQNYSDITRPSSGGIEVKRYIAPQVFATSGSLTEAGERLELVSLPRSYHPQAGRLNVEIATSLASAILPALDVLAQYPYENTEATVSRFLPNLMAYKAIKEFDVEAPEIEDMLRRNLEFSVEKLTQEQGYPGGWGWVKNGDPNAYITAYALLGLVEARNYGIEIWPDNFTRAIEFLQTSLTEVYGERQLADWEMERVVFIHFALQRAGVETQLPEAIYQARQQLNPWAQALMAIIRGGDQTILSDLQATAIRSATGAHWEETRDSHPNMSTSIFNTSIVLYALVQYDPNAPIVDEAVRHLMAHRDVFGGWASNYATAWSIMALAEVMQSTGELQAEYAFSASLNNQFVLEGMTTGLQSADLLTTEVEVSALNPQFPNALRFQREGGSGVLYYKAALDVSQPVEMLAPLDHGISISRAFYDHGVDCKEVECQPLTSAKSGELVSARVTLTLPHDMYYVVVEDFLPAGAEVLNTSLKTSQQGVEPGPSFSAPHPFRDGWGWWYFNQPLIYEDHVTWMADFLPAGTYEIVYTLVLMQPGEYQVIPAHAWQQYFPEVFGNGEGMVFAITTESAE